MRIHPPHQERGGSGTHSPRRAPMAGFTLQTFSIAMTVSGAIGKMVSLSLRFGETPEKGVCVSGWII